MIAIEIPDLVTLPVTKGSQYLYMVRRFLLAFEM
jgi:hypothetical protein